MRKTIGENNKTCTSDKSYRISENDDKKEVDFNFFFFLLKKKKTKKIIKEKSSGKQLDFKIIFLYTQLKVFPKLLNVL